MAIAELLDTISCRREAASSHTQNLEGGSPPLDEEFSRNLHLSLIAPDGYRPNMVEQQTYAAAPSCDDEPQYASLPQGEVEAWASGEKIQQVQKEAANTEKLRPKEKSLFPADRPHRYERQEYEDDG